MQYTPRFKHRNSIRPSRTGTDESITLAYKKVLGKLIQLLSSIAAAGIVLYILGWLRSIAYYDSLSADWILLDLPFPELVSRGIYPFTALLIGLLLTFTDVAKLAANEVRSVLKISVLLLIVESIAIIYFDSVSNYEHAANLAKITLILSASCAMLILGEIVLELKQSNFNLNSQQVWYVITTLASFGGMLLILGNSEGNRDKTPATSTLAHVVITDTTEDWRLLTMRNDNLYLVKLTDTLPVIKVIKTEKSAMVVPHKKDTREKLDKQETKPSTPPNNNAITLPHSSVPVTTSTH